MMQLMSDDWVFENTNPAPDSAIYSRKASITQFWQEFFRDSPQAHISRIDPMLQLMLLIPGVIGMDITIFDSDLDRDGQIGAAFTSAIVDAFLGDQSSYKHRSANQPAPRLHGACGYSPIRCTAAPGCARWMNASICWARVSGLCAAASTSSS